jgi:hypothetical protein
MECAARVAPEEQAHPGLPAAYTPQPGATREAAMPRKRAKLAKPRKQTPIEERLGPLRMAHPVVQRALAEGLRVEPIPPEQAKEELPKLIRDTTQPEIVEQRYKVSYEDAGTNAKRRTILAEFSEKHHETAMQSRWFRERCEEHERLRPLHSAETPRETSAKWYESSPEVLQRRQIVLKNPGLSAKSFCKLFDNQRISLPSGWEDKFTVTTWVEAYKIGRARANIQRIISTDREQE